MNAIQPSPYYFWDGGKIGIISDAPGAIEAIAKWPNLEIRTLAEWELLAKAATERTQNTISRSGPYNNPID